MLLLRRFNSGGILTNGARSLNHCVQLIGMDATNTPRYWILSMEHECTFFYSQAHHTMLTWNPARTCLFVALSSLSLSLSLFLSRSLSFSRVQKTAGEHHGERVDISDCKWVWSCAELQMCQRYLLLDEPNAPFVAPP